MTRNVLLDNVAHKDLKVRTGYSAEFGDSINSVMVFPTEFVHVQREYPILFRKDSSGQTQAFAMLGLDRDENLFLQGNTWNARYVPAALARGPFVIGFRQNEAGETINEMVTHIDLDHPRVSRLMANPFSGAREAIRRTWNAPTGCCSSSIAAWAPAAPMIAAFEEAGLLEAREIEIQLDERTKYQVPGFMTISEARLAELDGAQLEKLNKPGSCISPCSRWRRSATSTG